MKLLLKNRMLPPGKKAVSPVIAIVLLLMMTVAAAGAAYFWLTTIQSRMQKASYKSIEKVMESTGRRVTAQATLCKPTYPYKGLVGYWTFEEGSGNKTKDLSGNGNTATLYPGSGGEITSDSEMWNKSGQVGGALRTDCDDHTRVPDDDSLDGMSELTITGWIKRLILFDLGRRIWTKNYDWQSNLIDIGGYYSNSIIFTLHDGEQNDRIAGGGLEWNIWHHIAAVKTDTKMILYINGKKVSSTSHSNDVPVNDDPFIISGTGGHCFNGTLDEIRIYDRALSENEIKELYEAENHSARRRIDVTVRNIGSEEIPKATWVANLKQDGTNVETDAYNASSIGTGELKTLKFYFKNFKPNTEYTIQLQGTGTSTTVSC